MEGWEEELPPGYEAWEHQVTAVERVFSKFQSGDGATLLLLPTGAGKTVTASMIIRRGIHDLGWKTLFIAQRRKLIRQAADTFRKFGLVTAVEMADQKAWIQQEIQGRVPDVIVATVQSLSGDRLSAMDRERFDLICIDECHHSLGSPYGAILDWFDGYSLLGLTATPNGSRRNLGHRFNSVAYKLAVRDAIERGVIVPIVRRTVKCSVNLRELRMTTSDFSVGELAARILPAVEALAYNIKVNIGDRPTVVFTPDLGTASAVADMLRRQGVSAKYIAGSAGKFGMPEPERLAVESEFERGDFQVVVSCDLLSEGWDEPKVSCVAICRPTLEAWIYTQMVGRGFRTCEGKDDLLLLDFDWLTDESSKELCTPCILFQDSVSEDTMREVNTRIRAKPDADLLREIMEAEAERRYVDEVKLKFTGKYAERWESADDDPVGVGKIIGCKIRKTKEMRPEYGGGDATPAQVHRLAGLGVRHADGMSKWGASKLISRLEANAKLGMASFQQVRALLKLGVREDQARSLSAREAAAALAAHRSAVQGTFWDEG